MLALDVIAFLGWTSLWFCLGWVQSQFLRVFRELDSVKIKLL